MFSIPYTEGVPGCPNLLQSNDDLQISSDHGQTWASPTVIYPAGSNSLSSGCSNRRGSRGRSDRICCVAAK